MTQSLVGSLLEANLAASALILVVLLLRRPVRHVFGARVAYGLWLAPVLAVASVLVPARTIHAEEVAAVSFALLDQAWERSFVDPWVAVFWLWVVGVVVSLARTARSQARYLALAREGYAGPAVVGFLRPRVVLPADFAERFELREREVMLTHERTHLMRGDARITALAVLTRTLNWFNPLIHLAVDRLRVDQELACDAQVVGSDPASARIYAETMVKALLAAHPLPVGCAWPAGSPHPLAERVALIVQARPSRTRMLIGVALVALVSTGCGVIVWVAQPPTIVASPPPTASVPETDRSVELPAPTDPPLFAADTTTQIDAIEQTSPAAVGRGPAARPRFRVARPAPAPVEERVQPAPVRFRAGTARMRLDTTRAVPERVQFQGARRPAPTPVPGPASAPAAPAPTRAAPAPPPEPEPIPPGRGVIQGAGPEARCYVLPGTREPVCAGRGMAESVLERRQGQSLTGSRVGRALAPSQGRATTPIEVSGSDDGGTPAVAEPPTREYFFVPRFGARRAPLEQTVRLRQGSERNR